MACICSCLPAVLCKVYFAGALPWLPFLCSVFFPALPPISVLGQLSIWSVSIPLNSSVRGCLVGVARRVAMDTSFLVLEHCPAPPTL